MSDNKKQKKFSPEEVRELIYDVVDQYCKFYGVDDCSIELVCGEFSTTYIKNACVYRDTSDYDSELAVIFDPEKGQAYHSFDRGVIEKLKKNSRSIMDEIL